MTNAPATAYLAAAYNVFTLGKGVPRNIVGHVGHDLFEAYWDECTRDQPIHGDSAEHFKSARLIDSGVEGWTVRFEEAT